MCKKKQFKYRPSEIDECMRNFIRILNYSLKNHLKVVTCCCGHGVYPMTILVKNNSKGFIFDLVSGKKIPRKTRFYKKDKEGYYYFPEVSKEK